MSENKNLKNKGKVLRTTIYVKNMVCPRCISVVEGILSDLDLNLEYIKLGEIGLFSQVGKETKIVLSQKLLENGFELLEDDRTKLVEQVKTLIINQIHYSEDSIKINYSDLLADKTNMEYTSLSKLFSQVSGMTIEKFIMKHKIEKVKELLFYNELNLSQISLKMNYSSVAHLSSSFKKETGMPPTEFKKTAKPSHDSLDSF